MSAIHLFQKGRQLAPSLREGTNCLSMFLTPSPLRGEGGVWVAPTPSPLSGHTGKSNLPVEGERAGERAPISALPPLPLAGEGRVRGNILVAHHG